MNNLFMFVLLFSIATSAKASNTKIAELVMEQQVLSQKITFIYLQLYNEPSATNYTIEKDSCIFKFEENLKIIKEKDSTSKMDYVIEELSQNWEIYKKIANASINKKGVSKIIAECDYVLYACNQLLKAYEKQYTEEIVVEKTKDFIDVSMPIKHLYKQQMLAYRVSLFHIAVSKNIEVEANLEELKRTQKAYNENLNLYNLNFTSINSYLITDKNIEVRRKWQAFEGYLDINKITKEEMFNAFFILQEVIDKNQELIALYHGLNDQISVGKIINLITFENMLVQRMSKSYVAISLDQKSTSKFRHDITRDVKLFEDNLTVLLLNSNDEAVKESVDILKLLWKNYKRIILNWEDLNSGKILEKSHLLMACCDNIIRDVRIYGESIPQYKAFFVEKDQKNNIAQLLYVAGNQRALIERIPTYVMLCKYDHDREISKKRLLSAVKNYQSNLEKLHYSKLNTSNIDQLLSQKLSDLVSMDNIDALNKEEIPQFLSSYEEVFLNWEELNAYYEQKMDFLLLEKNKKNIISRF